MSGYLDVLDELLADGVSALSARFRRLQADYIIGRQQSDGGFPARHGGSDPYYTDFAARVLALCAPDSPAFAGIARYLQAAPPLRDIIDAFSYLNLARLLTHHGFAVAAPADACRDVLAAQRRSGGGFRPCGEDADSAYLTFLATLCCEMLGEPLPDAAGAVTAIAALHCPDGGFCQLAGEADGQTNATAAAIGVLTMQNALDARVVAAARDFLHRRQAADGGLQAHAHVPTGDLLSTFTGYLTFTGLAGEAQFDLVALARFIGALADPAGGFRAVLGDDGTDIEYTYYGIGTLALLRLAGG